MALRCSYRANGRVCIGARKRGGERRCKADRICEIRGANARADQANAAADSVFVRRARLCREHCRAGGPAIDTADISRPRAARDAESFVDFVGGMGREGGVIGYQVGGYSSISGKEPSPLLANGRARLARTDDRTELSRSKLLFPAG